MTVIADNKKRVVLPTAKPGDRFDAQGAPVTRKICTERKAERIFDDLPPLDSNPRTSEEVTDLYLADLAQKHGMKLATFDEQIVHPAIESIPDALKRSSS